MNKESIKILRSKIPIPLNKAIELLKKNNGDVELSEQDFNDENITEICKVTECEEETARKEYQICDHDVVKAIERINQKPVTIGTGKFSDSKIGFVLWPENAKGEFYKTEKRNDVFIPAEDFDIILNTVQSVFLLQNEWNNTIEDEFDMIGHNFFDVKSCRLIIEKIGLLNPKDEREKDFLLEIINWLRDKLVYAEYIVVYGNL